MSTAKDKTPLLLRKQREALDNYLAELLSEVEDYREGTVQPGSDSLPETTLVSPVVADTNLETAPPGAEADREVEPERVVPDWAQSPFQCLLFKLKGMTLGVPLVELDSISRWEQDVTPLPGQPEWQVGLLLHRGKQVAVIDLQKLIMPERFESLATRHPGSHILVVGGERWGLACDGLQRPVMLQAEDVRWRDARQSKHWMAGTLVDKLCILLDVPGLIEQLGHD